LSRNLHAKNVAFMPVPTCLAIAGIKPEELLDGIQNADKEKFFSFTNGIILTLNY
jgi:hypothetical protein